jgi:hypothetical protein
MDRQTPQRNNVNAKEWIAHGLEHGYLIETCLMHRDMEVWSDEERSESNEGYDPCIPRLVVKHDVA